jgi:energy-converting hydrogenase B subunit D
VTVLVGLSLTLVAVAGTAVVLTDKPERQAVTYSLLGLALGVLFLVLQAPDVALSQIAVGAAVMPMMILLAISTMRKDQAQRREDDS